MRRGAWCEKSSLSWLRRAELHVLRDRCGPELDIQKSSDG